MRSRKCGLDDDRETELRREASGLVRCRRDPLLDDRDSVRLEQRARVVGVEPDVGSVLESGGHDPARTSPIYAFERRDAACRAAQPLGSRGCPAEGARGGLGVSIRGDPGLEEDLRNAAGVHHGSDDRLLRALRGLGHGERDLVGGRGDRRHEEHEHRVHAAVFQQDRKDGLVRRGRRRSEHVDGVRNARLDGQELREPRHALVGQRRQLEPGCLTGVGGEDPEPSGVRQHGDAAAER